MPNAAANTITLHGTRNTQHTTNPLFLYILLTNTSNKCVESTNSILDKPKINRQSHPLQLFHLSIYQPQQTVPDKNPHTTTHHHPWTHHPENPVPMDPLPLDSASMNPLPLREISLFGVIVNNDTTLSKEQMYHTDQVNLNATPSSATRHYFRTHDLNM